MSINELEALNPKPSTVMGGGCSTNVLIGPSGSGKSNWLSNHLSNEVKVSLVPSEQDAAEMKLWRVGHLLGMDELFRYLTDSRLQWSCPGCGQMRMQSPQSGISDELRRRFNFRVHIGFPYSGPREALLDKGYWRIISDEGILPLPEQSWVDADVLVDRLDLSGVDSSRLLESVEQCLVAGLGEVVVRGQNRRLVFGSNLRCDVCGLNAVKPKMADLFLWIKGKKERDKEWDSFFWGGVRFSEWMQWTALDWMSAHQQFETEPWWSIWEKRVQKMAELGLGQIDLERQLKNLSSGERSLIMLGRCLEWSVSGCDLLFEHPGASLFGPDLAHLNRVMRRLGEGGNRVWVETHEKLEGLCFEREISLGQAMERDIFVPGGLWHVLDDWLTPEVKKLIKASSDQGQGGIWVWPGVRGAGKTRNMRRLFQSFDKRTCSHFQRIDHLDTDPWDFVSSNGTLLEAIGLWAWLVERILSTPEAKAGRFLPGHFDRLNPLGVCSVCMSEAGEGEVCSHCGGTGFGQQVLSLKLFGLRMADYLLCPLEQIYKETGDHLTQKLRLKLRDCCTAGLATYSGGQPLSGLSLTQQWGMRVLTFLWKAEKNSLLGLDEPFRGADRAFVRAILTQMSELSLKGSVIICSMARTDFSWLWYDEKKGRGA